MKKSKIYADLHVHSTASDGLLSPAEVVDSSIETGLSYIALTDHDTIDGVAPARIRGKEKGLKIIAGIELSCGWEGRDSSIHVLGLFINENSPTLNKLLAEQKQFRYYRALKIVDLLGYAGVEVGPLRKQFEASTDKVLGRPHIARYLLETGVIKDFQQAFDKYLTQGKPAYVPKDHVTPEVGIEAIKSAGGIAIIAHPGLIPDWDVVWKRIRNLEWDGIETYYSEHSNALVRRYEEIVAEKGWISTGGSDYHGDYGKHTNRLGKFGLDEQQFEGLLEWCANKSIDTDC